jgi:hypothetical protein
VIGGPALVASSCVAPVEPVPDGGATDRPRRGRGDRGAATSLAVALLTPLFVVLAFAAVQAALWSHAKTEARVIARDTAALVARSGVAASDAQASAAQVLAADTDLRDVAVLISESASVVTVTVTGEAPGILRGTSSVVSVTSAIPVEGITP